MEAKVPKLVMSSSPSTRFDGSDIDGLHGLSNFEKSEETFFSVFETFFCTVFFLQKEGGFRQSEHIPLASRLTELELPSLPQIRGMKRDDLVLPKSF